MKTEAHQRYGEEDLPGVTAVIAILNKPSLPKWANNLGLKGIDSNRYVSERSEIGTLSHEAIMCHFLKKKVDTSDYSVTILFGYQIFLYQDRLNLVNLFPFE